MSKAISLSMTLCASLLVLAGCGSNTTSDSSKATSHNEAAKSSKVEDDKPIQLTQDMLNMSGKDFAKKYDGKVIQFTSAMFMLKKRMSIASGKLVDCADLNFGVNKDFSDGSYFIMKVSPFDLPPINGNWVKDADDTQTAFTTSKTFPVVHVTARVNSFDGDLTQIKLIPVKIAGVAAVYPTGENVQSK